MRPQGHLDVIARGEGVPQEFLLARAHGQPDAPVPLLVETGHRLARDRGLVIADLVHLHVEVLALDEDHAVVFPMNGRRRLFLQDGSIDDARDSTRSKDSLELTRMLGIMVDLEELKEYSKRTGETQLTRSIDLVNKHGKALPSLIALLRKRHVEPEMRHTADCCFSTVHRCKGLEYDEVFLCGDFTHEKMIHVFKEDPDRTPEELAEEVNLLYVAITRAKQRLHLPKECVPESFKQPMRHSIKLIRDSDSMEKLDAAASRKEWFWRSAGERSAQPKRERKTREPKGSEPREKPGSAGTFWSKSDEEFLKSEFKKGTPPRMIADTLGRTRGAITSRLKLLHLIEE